VCAANGCITAVGTVFDVRLYSNHARVWVQEGTVDVTPRDASSASKEAATSTLPFWRPVRLTHGHEVSYNASTGASGATVADPLTEGAWTKGSLIYFGRPLGEVIEDVQRYTPRRIVLAPDASLHLYSGSVLQQHLDQWIRGLSQVFPLEIVDCRNLQESIGSETDDIIRSCASDSSRILIRSR
jgi:transmembrane sensor